MPGGSCRRMHKCDHNPCKARWPDSKYGLVGPPIHAQEVDAAEAMFGPAVPTSVPLRSGDVPPAVAMSLARPQLRIGCAAVAEESLSAEAGHKVFQTILELARQIRSPRSYVGYSFFVLLGVSKMPTLHVGRQPTNKLVGAIRSLGSDIRSGGLCSGWCRVLHAIIALGQSGDGPCIGRPPAGRVSSFCGMPQVGDFVGV